MASRNDKATFGFPDNLTFVLLVFTLLLGNLLQVWFSKPLAMGLGFFIGVSCLMLHAKQYNVPRVHVMSRGVDGCRIRIGRGAG
jgi:hypothetical protein